MRRRGLFHFSEEFILIDAPVFITDLVLIVKLILIVKPFFQFLLCISCRSNRLKLKCRLIRIDVEVEVFHRVVFFFSRLLVYRFLKLRFLKFRLFVLRLLKSRFFKDRLFEQRLLGLLVKFYDRRLVRYELRLCRCRFRFCRCRSGFWLLFLKRVSYLLKEVRKLKL